jgi:pyruvate kinase
MKRRFTRTKVIATVGPASNTPEMLRKLLLAGVDTFRLNFSHGSHQSHLEAITRIRSINDELGMHAGIFGDLQGPKIRIGEVLEGGVDLIEGKDIYITTEKVLSTEKKLYVDYPQFAQEVAAGDTVLLDDGQLELRVVSSNRKDTVKAKVVYGGRLTSRKGVNLPDSDISLPSLTKKDLLDLKFAIKHNLNWVALSFVRKAEDIIDLKKRIKRSGKNIRVIAKIEKPQAVKNIDEIIDVTDAVMVARGDLGVEMPIEEITIVQKDIIQRCIAKAKPVIIATQMLQSMIEHPRPTRAEITDVANGIFDGADALMLSAETASGKYPVKAVEVMNDIATRMEAQSTIYSKKLVPNLQSKTLLADAICYNACKIAEEVNAVAIISMSRSGYSAIRTASYRPASRIFVIMDDSNMLNTLSMVWGVQTFCYKEMRTTDETIEDVKELLKEEGMLHRGDIVVSTASMPLHWKGTTNMLKISRID